jgi:hypothetical protein
LSITFVLRSAYSVGVGSLTLSKTLISPLFSATNTLPSAAKRTAIGTLRPVITAVSWKPLGTAAAAAARETVGNPSAAWPKTVSGALSASADAAAEPVRSAAAQSVAASSRSRETTGPTVSPRGLCGNQDGTKLVPAGSCRLSA